MGRLTLAPADMPERWAAKEAEIARLKLVISNAVTSLKLLYMGAGVGQIKGRDALKELNNVIEELHTALLKDWPDKK